MSWSQALLLIAILGVFLSWRRARRQVTTLRQSIEEHRDRNTFTFEAVDDAAGRRFVVLDANGAEISPDTLSWTEHGLAVVPATAREHDEAAPEPGAAAELIDDAGEVVVWDRRLTRRIGVVDAEAAVVVRRRLEKDEVGGCIVLRASPGPTGRMDLLLVHAGVEIDL